MVDPQAIDVAPAEELKSQPMNRVEHFGLFGTYGSQLAHVEKSAVVDFVGRRLPVRQAVDLRVEQFIEPVEAAGCQASRSAARDSVR